MNKKRMTLSLVLAVVMGLSIFFAPIIPMMTGSKAEVISPQVFTPEEAKQVEELYTQLDSPSYKPEIDALLLEWRETGMLDRSVNSFRGDPSVVIFGAPWMDIESLQQTVNMKWWVDLQLFRVAMATVPSADALDHLLTVDGVTTVTADMEFGLDSAETPSTEGAPTTGLDMSEIRKVVGAEGATASSYTGAGVTVGLIDTGTDFGNPDLQHAYDPGTYDPYGSGVFWTKARANTTVVANTTAWLEDGNVLTYTDGTNWFINVTLDFEPDTNFHGLNSLSPAYYVYNTGALNKPNATAFFEDYLWQDYCIPDPATVYGDFHFGYGLQRGPTLSGGAARIFTPVLVYNATADNDWHLAVDWEGADAWSRFFMGAYRYRTLDLNVTANQADLISRIDLNFTDDILDEVYDFTNPIVAHDYTGDMVDDYSVGTICWAYDSMGEYFEYFSDEVLFNGFRSDGDAVALTHDDGTHGTATAGHIASAGTHTYYNVDNETTFTMKGIAPDADIMAVKALGYGDWFGAFLWTSGFDYNETTGEFYYNAASTHLADLTSNSWGWVTAPSAQVDYHSLTWDILGTPGFLDAAYPGVLQVFSAGNEGSGYMTSGPPGSAPSVLTVGASTTSHWLDYLYGPDQPFEGIASFSSKGPSYTGYSKPDILAPGLAGYSLRPWWATYWIPVWQPGASYANYTLFSGTSQAAPVAAGVAALVMEALGGSGGPFSVKNILQATAVDMGYDPATQGFGRVDADAACDFAANDVGMVGSTADSFDNFASIVADSWTEHGWFENGLDVNESAKAFPTGNLDGSLFFGQVNPGDTATIHYSAYDNAADLYGTPMGSGGFTAVQTYLREGDTYTFTDTTFSYNDTVSVDDQVYGFHNIRDGIGAAIYDTAMAAYDYVTVAVAFDEADVAGDYPWMFLYDWTDDNDDDMANLWNGTHGNELSRLTSASDDGTCNFMPFAGFGGLQGNLTLVIHDPMFDEAGVTWWNTTGNDFTATVIFWEENTATDIVLSAGGTTNTVNLTLTVPSVDAGIYAGFVDLDDGGTQTLRIPYTYTVMANLTGAVGTVHTIVDGMGAELEPYDNAVFGAMDEDPDDWDFRSYAIHNSHATAAYLGVRVVFADEGNDMYVTVLDSDGYSLASGSAETDTTTAVIAEIDGAGDYYLLVHPIALNGTVSLPVDYKIEVMWYETLTDQAAIWSYTTDDRAGVFPVAENDTLWGDHAVINASYPAFNLANMPEFEVTTTTISFLAGVYATFSGDVAEPTSENWPFDAGITASYTYHVVDGIAQGDVVNCEVTMHNPGADPALLVYEYDGPLTSASSPIEIFDQGGGGFLTEGGSFTAANDMSVALVVYSFYYTGAFPDTYDVSLDSRVGLDVSAAGPEVTYDSELFDANVTRAIVLSGDTDTNVDFELQWYGLTFQNFFTPSLDSIGVDVAGDPSMNITWIYSDLNAQDTHLFSVYVSADAGTSWQLIAADLNVTSHVWDSTGFTEGSYMAQVRVLDSYGLGDRIDSTAFDAGTVAPPTTTTTTTPPETTTTTPPPPPPDYVLIGLIAGIGAGVVVILILFLVKRR